MKLGQAQLNYTSKLFDQHLEQFCLNEKKFNALAIALTENLGLKPRPSLDGFCDKIMLAVKRTQKRRSRSSGQLLIRKER
jgi:hypothetical protein